MLLSLHLSSIPNLFRLVKPSSFIHCYLLLLLVLKTRNSQEFNSKSNDFPFQKVPREIIKPDIFRIEGNWIIMNNCLACIMWNYLLVMLYIYIYIYIYIRKKNHITCLFIENPLMKLSVKWKKKSLCIKLWFSSSFFVGFCRILIF